MLHMCHDVQVFNTCKLFWSPLELLLIYSWLDNVVSCITTTDRRFDWYQGEIMIVKYAISLLFSFNSVWILEIPCRQFSGLSRAAFWQREIRQRLFGITRELFGLKFNPSWLEKKIDQSTAWDEEDGGLRLGGGEEAWMHWHARARPRSFIAYWASGHDVHSRQLQRQLEGNKQECDCRSPGRVKAEVAIFRQYDLFQVGICWSNSGGAV